jgi:hypothetical protein
MAKQQGLKGRQLREASSPGKVYRMVKDYTTVYLSGASLGGAATETLTVTGLQSDDEIISATQSVKGANGTALIAYAQTANDNQLACEWTANPGAGAKVRVAVRRLRK